MSPDDVLKLDGVSNLAPDDPSTSVTIAHGIVTTELGEETLQNLQKYLIENEADVLDDILKDVSIALPAMEYTELADKGWDFYEKIENLDYVRTTLKPGEATAACNFSAAQCRIFVGKDHE